MTRTSKNNLLLFLLSNNGCSEDLVFNVHTRIGEKLVRNLISGTKAKTRFSQARYFKTRADKWEYMKKKNPILLEFEKMLL